jgi:hypothetical protein
MNTDTCLFYNAYFIETLCILSIIITRLADKVLNFK